MSRRSKHRRMPKPALERSEQRCRRDVRWIRGLFNRWLAANRETLAFRIAPKRKRGHQRLQIAGVAKELEISMGGGGIAVSVWKNDRCVDFLHDIDACPQAVPGGYVCSLCEETSREIYPTLETFWCAHIFDDFGRWINERLALARWLRIVIFDCGSSYACLVNNQEDMEQHSRRLLAFFGGLKKLDESHAFSAEELEHPQTFMVPVRTAVQN